MTVRDLRYSLRRLLIDEFQSREVATWPAGLRVLDLGGHKVQKRGTFDVGRYPIHVTCVNISGVKHPDVQGDATRLPFGSAAFDAVICAELLEHVYDPRRVVQEIHLVLKPNGRILITVPFLVQIHGDPGDFARYTDAFWGRLLPELGFEQVAIEKQGMFWSVMLDAMRTWLIDSRGRRPGQRWRWAVLARLSSRGRAWATQVESSGGASVPDALKQFTTGFGIVGRKAPR